MKNFDSTTAYRRRVAKRAAAAAEAEIARQRIIKEKHSQAFRSVMVELWWYHENTRRYDIKDETPRERRARWFALA